MATKLSTISRRRALKTAAAAVLGGGAAVLNGGTLAAQGGAPAILANAQGGGSSKAFVTYSRPICRKSWTHGPSDHWTAAGDPSGSAPDLLHQHRPGPDTWHSNQPGNIVGHARGRRRKPSRPQVLSCRVGDRVIVNLHAACGRCSTV